MPEFIQVTDKLNIQSDLTHFLPVAQGRLITTGGSGDFAEWGAGFDSGGVIR